MPVLLLTLFLARSFRKNRHREILIISSTSECLLARQLKWLMVRSFYILSKHFGGLLRNPFGSLQRFYMVKPCPKELKCDVEVSSYAIREVEEYKNFCDRPRDQRPLPEEVIGDIGEHLTTIHLRRCDRGKRCLYEGSTPPGGFPNSWQNGATYSTSELAVLKNNEIHTWDRGFDDDGNQVWGVKAGPYEFKPAPSSSYSDMFSPLNFPPQQFFEKRIEGSFVLQE
ncbi:chromophore lyase CRL, chloroplastic isoform X5 [Citrus sinensis]|uniref:chromophore lyase CRL, chloroplastic isoform X5 n=1 Tax=Citrus sinensis TaxID=2711 RepID=UPI0003D6EEB1|nr:chromophore lyase CRL, chloroplastic isoform X5 [Citrus sinensis]